MQKTGAVPISARKNSARETAKTVTLALFTWYHSCMKTNKHRQITDSKSSRNVQLFIEKSFGEKIIPENNKARLSDKTVDEKETTSLEAVELLLMIFQFFINEYA